MGKSEAFSIKTRLVFSEFLSCTDSDEFWKFMLQDTRRGFPDRNLKINTRGNLTD